MKSGDYYLAFVERCLPVDSDINTYTCLSQQLSVFTNDGVHLFLFALLEIERGIPMHLRMRYLGTSWKKGYGVYIKGLGIRNLASTTTLNGPYSHSRLDLILGIGFSN